MTELREYDERRGPAEQALARGLRKQAERKLEEAEREYRRSIALFPTAEGHTFLGWALSFEGRIDEAIECCKRAIEVDPSFGNPYNDIGAYLIRLGRGEEAIPWLERAKSAPRYDCAHFPYYNLGRVYEQLGRLEEALREYKGALERARERAIP